MVEARLMSCEPTLEPQWECTACRWNGSVLSDREEAGLHFRCQRTEGVRGGLTHR